MILTVFRRICSSSSEGDERLGSAQLPAIPDRGELLNIDGAPFVVYERAWAWSSESATLYCYLRLSPLQTPKEPHE